MTPTKTKRRKNPPRPGQQIISCYAPDDLHARVRMLAGARRMSVSDFARAALVDAIEAYALEAAVNPVNNEEVMDEQLDMPAQNDKEVMK